MRKLLLLLSLSAIVIGFLAVPLAAHWAPQDGHKMHYPQLPDSLGWDVNATQPMIIADDFMCTETGFIKDIHFWGSWKNGVVGQVVQFVLSLHSDIPVSDTIPFSRPGATLWEAEISDFLIQQYDPPTMEGWYDPASGEIIPNSIPNYFQYNVFLPDSLWFPQDSGTIYWLNISAIVQDPSTQWGWKSTQDHWNDDAVWAMWGISNWVDIWEPSVPIVNQFWGGFTPTGDTIGMGGTDYYGEGWYWYPSDWWNIWFYDHPLDTTRSKRIHISFDVQKMDPITPSFITFAANWSNDQWNPTGDSIPPIQPSEEIFIVRDTLLVGQDIEGFFEFDVFVENYNPEWVSIDLQGWNYVISNGTIIHECIQSMDMSFVITNGRADNIPTLNEWGMLILGLLLLMAGTIAVIRRRKMASAKT